MRYTSRSRDRYRGLMSLLTGLAAFGTVAASGAATGLAARQTAVRNRERADAAALAAEQARADSVRSAMSQRPRTVRVTKTRATRTVVVTRVVHAVSGPGVASVGGGAVTAPQPVSAPAASSASHSTSTSAAPPPTPPPAAAPAPAPSSGS